MVEGLLTVALLLEGVAMALCDRGMRTNRAEGVTDELVRWAPLYWEKPELFDSKGNAYRRGAILSAVLSVLTVLALAVTGAFV